MKVMFLNLSENAFNKPDYADAQNLFVLKPAHRIVWVDAVQFDPIISVYYLFGKSLVAVKQDDRDAAAVNAFLLAHADDGS